MFGVLVHAGPGRTPPLLAPKPAALDVSHAPTAPVLQVGMIACVGEAFERDLMGSDGV